MTRIKKIKEDNSVSFIRDKKEKVEKPARAPLLIINEVDMSASLVKLEEFEVPKIHLAWKAKDRLGEPRTWFHYRHELESLDVYITENSKLIYNNKGFEGRNTDNDLPGKLYLLESSLTVESVEGVNILIESRVKTKNLDQSVFLTDASPEWRKTVVKGFSSISGCFITDSRLNASADGWNRLKDSVFHESIMAGGDFNVENSHLDQVTCQNGHATISMANIYESNFTGLNVDIRPKNKITIRNQYMHFGWGDKTSGAPTIEITSMFDILQIELGGRNFTFMRVKSANGISFVGSNAYDRNVTIQSKNLFDHEFFKVMVLGEDKVKQLSPEIPQPVGLPYSDFRYGAPVRVQQPLDEFSECLVRSVEQAVQSRFRLVEMLLAMQDRI